MSDEAIQDILNQERAMSVGIVRVLTEEMLSLPKEIKAQEMLLITTQKAFDAVKLKMKNWDLTEMQDIASQVVIEEGKKPKAIFSNESARKAELEGRKDGHAGYGDMENEHTTLKLAMDQGKSELAYLYNRFSSIRNIAKMVAGSMNRGG